MRLLAILAFLALGASSTTGHDLIGLDEQFAGMSAEDAAAARAEFSSLTSEGLDASAQAALLGGEAGEQFLEQFSALNAAQSEQLYLKTALWPQNHELRVCFLDGSATAREHVLEEFATILAHTNLTLDEQSGADCSDGPNDMQISFATRGCYSYYGKQARTRIENYPQLPTVGLCKKSGPTWSAKDNGTIRHELMHGLGAIHEHQHPSGSCVDEFNIKYMEDNRLFDPDEKKNKAAIVTNIEVVTKKFDIDDVAQLPYDPLSVMHYDLPPQFFLTGKKSPCYLGEPNNELSQADVEMLGKLYPQE